MEKDTVYQIPNPQFSDFSLLFIGHAICEPNHHYGSAVRTSYILHVVTEGRGVFRVNQKTYHLKVGDCFLIEPNVLTYYEADSIDPWTYVWIGFGGTDVDTHLNRIGIYTETPVFQVHSPQSLEIIIKQMLDIKGQTISDQYFLQAKLLEFFATLLTSKIGNISTEPSENDYVQDVIAFIETHYDKPIKITDIANYIGLNRSYLSSLFKNKTNMTLKGYLSDFRLTRSRELLFLSQLSIEEVAESCGYNDPLVFSKAFKKRYLMPPSEFRKLEEPIRYSAQDNSKIVESKSKL